MSRPIKNWKQVFGAVLIVGGAGLLVGFFLDHELMELWSVVWSMGFPFWLGWRLWSIGSKQADAAPPPDPTAAVP